MVEIHMILDLNPTKEMRSNPKENPRYEALGISNIIIP
jgi:hypothetical protein